MATNSKHIPLEAYESNSWKTYIPPCWDKTGVSSLSQTRGHHLTVQTEEDEHQKEETGPEWRQRHHRNSLWICNECETRTCTTQKTTTVVLLEQLQQHHQSSWQPLLQTDAEVADEPGQGQAHGELPAESPHQYKHSHWQRDRKGVMPTGSPRQLCGEAVEEVEDGPGKDHHIFVDFLFKQLCMATQEGVRPASNTAADMPIEMRRLISV
ncbi:hypothetical protein EYF80_007517 [Liparis tanakae]|uniref:Uncharacterized protein n=1 Tax=Liparis tanakae TaxID=230148 RepID=A0A4Z2IVX7_9TELE|nr:hypothetical protein EYF80_007517 [Liparis tanakae]